jgi:uncharacterized protein (DUF1800 family)
VWRLGASGNFHDRENGSSEVAQKQIALLFGDDIPAIADKSFSVINVNLANLWEAQSSPTHNQARSAKDQGFPRSGLAKAKVKRPHGERKAREAKIRLGSSSSRKYAE